MSQVVKVFDKSVFDLVIWIPFLIETQCYSSRHICYERFRGATPAMSVITVIFKGIGKRVLITTALMGLSGWLWAGSLDQDIDRLKTDVAALSETLFELEEDILHPADTRVAVYLSMADRTAFVLDSVELSINGRPVVSHLYTDSERQALSQGGVQRLYIGNLPIGEHELNAALNGQAENARYVRQQAAFEIRKSEGETQVQLVLQAPAPDYQPEFSLKVWQ